MNEMLDMWKKKKMNTFGILYSWFLAKVFLNVRLLELAIVKCSYHFLNIVIVI